MNDLLLNIFGSIVAALVFDIVLVKIYNYSTGADRDIFWRARSKTINDLDPEKTFDQLKKSLKILVIDDEDIFPIDFFRDNGYNIEKWDSVKDYNRLENGDFDIIILDILGVATNISDDDGMGVLEDIKMNNPTQIVIAYSMHHFDLSKQRFFRLADDTIGKPAKATTIKEKIDTLISSKFSTKYPLNLLREILLKGNFQPEQIRTLETKIARFHKLGSEPNWGEMLKFISDPTLRKRVQTTSKRILKNMQK